MSKEETGTEMGTYGPEDLDWLVADLNSPSLRVRAALRSHLTSDTDDILGGPVLVESEYAFLAGLGFAIGFAAAILLTQRPLLSVAAGVAAGAGLAEWSLATQKRTAREVVEQQSAAVARLMADADDEGPQ